MERDFMGLNSRVVKKEIVEGRSEDSGFARSSGVPWLFPNKFSAFSPPKSEQNEKQAKNSVPHFLVNTAGVSPSSSAVSVGASEQRANNKALDLPAQLTIFYGGSVSVFDNITPEKAKAIMCLAGKWVPPPSPCFDHHKLPPTTGDRVPNSGHASPISVSSRPIDLGTPAATVSNDEFVKPEPPKIRSSSTVVSTAVPQARKASLARFLEKRKERVTSVAPYTMNN